LPNGLSFPPFFFLSFFLFPFFGGVEAGSSFWAFFFFLPSFPLPPLIGLTLEYRVPLLFFFFPSFPCRAGEPRTLPLLFFSFFSLPPSGRPGGALSNSAFPLSFSPPFFFRCLFPCWTAVPCPLSFFSFFFLSYLLPTLVSIFFFSPLSRVWR